MDAGGRATHGAVAERFCWLEGKHWTEICEKPGKVQALVVEFSADCAAIRAKSGEGGYSEAVDSWRKGVYTSYTLCRTHPNPEESVSYCMA